MGWWFKLWSNIWLLSFHAVWTKLSVWSKFLFISSCLFMKGYVLPTGRALLNLWYKDQNSSFDNSFILCLVLLYVQNYFGQVPIVLDGSNSFRSNPNHFGKIQNIENSLEKSSLNLTTSLFQLEQKIVKIRLGWLPVSPYLRV